MPDSLKSIIYSRKKMSSEMERAFLCANPPLGDGLMDPPPRPKAKEKARKSNNPLNFFPYYFVRQLVRELLTSHIKQQKNKKKNGNQVGFRFFDTGINGLQ